MAQVQNDYSKKMSQTPSEQSIWIVVENFGRIDADRLEQVRQRLQDVARDLLQPDYEAQCPTARAGIAESSKLRIFTQER